MKYEIDVSTLYACLLPSYTSLATFGAAYEAYKTSHKTSLSAFETSEDWRLHLLTNIFFIKCTVNEIKTRFLAQFWPR